MTHQRKLVAIFCGVALVLGGAAGCGDDGDEPSGGAGAATGTTTGPATTGPATTGTGSTTHPGNGERPESGGGRPSEGAETAAGGLIVGIGEHGTAMFDQPLFRDLGIKHARLVTAYDTTKVKFEREIVDAWLAGAKRAGVEPFITFGHSRVSPEKLPSVAEYRARVKEFRERWPQVRVFAAWNEANHASQPTHDDPRAAADFYDALRAECRGCTLVAGDLLDEGDLLDYLAEYRRHLDSEPAIWGLHNYSDTNRFRRTGLRRLLGATKGDVWLTETGGLYKFGRGFPASAKRQARAVRYTFTLARQNPRVRRVYLYNWTGAKPGARFDSGITGPDGTPRPAYGVVQQALRG